MEQYLIENDWYETDAGWKHPDTDEEVYTLEEAIEMENE